MIEYIFSVPVKRGFEEVADLFHLLNQDSPLGYIAGSYAAWMGAANERWQPHDVDVFTTSEAAFNELPKLLRGVDYIQMDDGDIVKAFEHLITRKGLQLIKPHSEWSAFPDDILESFDLTVGLAALISQNTTLAHIHAGGGFSKILRINEPVRTLKRVLKYHKRGVEFDDWELMKLFKAWDFMTPEQKEIADLLHSQQEEVDATGFYFDYDDYFFEE